MRLSQRTQSFKKRSQLTLQFEFQVAVKLASGGFVVPVAAVIVTIALLAVLAIPHSQIAAAMELSTWTWHAVAGTALVIVSGLRLATAGFSAKKATGTSIAVYKNMLR